MAWLLAFSGPTGAIILFGGWVACPLIELRFLQRVSGVTGDLLGANCEIVETGLLLVCAAVAHWLAQFTNWGS